MRERIFYAITSGIHPTLSISELKGILESENITYNIITTYDQLVLFKAENKRINRILERAGLIKEVGIVIKITSSDVNSLIRDIKDIDWSFIDGEFKVEYKRLRGHGKHINEREVVLKVADTIIRTTNQRVNLVKPKYLVKLIATNGVIIMGISLGKLDTKQFLFRNPANRPYFHPGALPPHIARVFVNLSRPRYNCPYLDPFCGTGGFLIESCIMGYYSIGCDIDPRMVEGSIINLKYYGLSNFEVVQADATKLPFTNMFCSIGTDPPYGRSTSTKGRRLFDLIEGFLHSAASVLKRNSFICFAAPHVVDISDVISDCGMKVLEKHFMRVHGSLTRIIWLVYMP